MKIILPITLAEPLTIPWDLIVSNEAAQYQTIYRALRKYLDVLERDGMSPRDGSPRFISTANVEASLRVIARRSGGLDVMSLCGRVLDTGKCTGNIYHVWFRLRPDGLQREVKLRS